MSALTLGYHHPQPLRNPPTANLSWGPITGKWLLLIRGTEFQGELMWEKTGPFKWHLFQEDASGPPAQVQACLLNKPKHPVYPPQHCNDMVTLRRADIQKARTSCTVSREPFNVLYMHYWVSPLPSGWPDHPQYPTSPDPILEMGKLRLEMTLSNDRAKV